MMSLKTSWLNKKVRPFKLDEINSNLPLIFTQKNKVHFHTLY